MRHKYFEWDSPLGRMTIVMDDEAINGLWFNGQKHFCLKHDLMLMDKLDCKKTGDICDVAKRIISWLEIYFSGKRPDFDIATRFIVGTDYQRAVWGELKKIEYGKTVSYKDIGDSMGNTHARAVGGAVGKNPISIIVPCHRVVGASGAMTGFAGGVDKKIELLRLEKSF